jgi:hypothetical protein
MSTIRATYVQHGSSAVPNITLNASGQVIVASGIVSSGTFAAPTGSAAAPGVYFVGDTNTGLYSPGADQVAVATNGTGRLFVDASGNVGVGGSAPNYSDHKTLSLFGAANNGAGFIQFTDTSNNADAAIFADDGSLFINADYDNTSSDSSIRFRVDGSSEKVRITSAGRVGIGTSQPVGQTYIAGPNTSNFGVAADAALNIAAASGALANRIINLNFAVVPSATNAVAAIGMAYGSQSGFGNGHLIFGTRSVTTDTAPTERMRIDSSGRVGIGTTSPSSYSAAGDNLVIADAGNCGITLAAGTSSTGQILFADGTTGADTIRGIIGYTHASNDLFFGTNAVERLRIDSSGRLLVGTSTARNIFDNLYAPRLQVEGTDATQALSVTINAASSDGSYFFLGKSRGASPGDTTVVQSGDRLGAVVFQGADGSKLIRAAQIESLVDGTPGANDMPGRLVFSTTSDGASSPTERLRITSAGRVGIGTSTPGTYLSIAATATDPTGFEGSAAFSINSNLSPKFQLGVGTGTIGYSAWIQNSVGTTTYPLSLQPLGGLVGIGTASPQRKLVVSEGGAQGFEFYPGDTGGGNTLNHYNRSTASFVNVTTTADQHIWARAEGEKVRIDSSGRLLVGTSSAIASGTEKIQASGSLSLYDPTSSTAGAGSVINFRTDGGATGAIKASISGQNDSTFSYAGRLVFSTTASGAGSPTERMRITQNGLTSCLSPASTALIAATGVGAGTSTITFACRHSATTTISGTNSLYVYSNGNVVNTNNSYGAISDIKLKENIVDADPQWDDLKALQVRKYNFKEETGHSTHTQIGLIAQEAELVSPGLVTESPDRDEDGNDLGTVTKSVNYSVLYMKAVKALQEAMERIEVLEQRLNDAGIN